jgi:hypothetical protein
MSRGDQPLVAPIPRSTATAAVPDRLRATIAADMDSLAYCEIDLAPRARSRPMNVAVREHLVMAIDHLGEVVEIVANLSGARHAALSEHERRLLGAALNRLHEATIALVAAAQGADLS